VHVIVATDGNLDPQLIARFVGPLAGNGGSATVLTVVEIPRGLLGELRGVFGEQPAPSVDSDAEYVGVPGGGSGPIGWPGDDAMLTRYLADKEAERCGPVAEALAAVGVEADTDVLEGENAATTLLKEAQARKADVIVVGSQGQGLLEGLLGSTGNKVARLSKCPVLLLRGTL
jgi:nucleotide-binding universal stress UspA family protein